MEYPGESEHLVSDPLQLSLVDIDIAEERRMRQALELPGFPFTEAADIKDFLLADQPIICAAQANVQEGGDVVRRVTGVIMAAPMRHDEPVAPWRESVPAEAVWKPSREDLEDPDTTESKEAASEEEEDAAQETASDTEEGGGTALLEPDPGLPEGTFIPGVLELRAMCIDPRMGDARLVRDWLTSEFLKRPGIGRYEKLVVRVTLDDQDSPLFRFAQAYGFHLSEIGARDGEEYRYEISLDELARALPPTMDIEESIYCEPAVHRGEIAEFHADRVEPGLSPPKNLHIMRRYGRRQIEELMSIKSFYKQYGDDELFYHYLRSGGLEEDFLIAQATVPGFWHLKEKGRDREVDMTPPGGWNERRAVAAMAFEFAVPQAGQWKGKQLLDISTFYVDAAYDYDETVGWFLEEIKKRRRQMRYDVLSTLVYDGDHHHLNLYWQHGFRHERSGAGLDVLSWDPTWKKS